MSYNRCVWCGREFESFNPESFCGRKCEREYKAAQAEDRKVAQQKEAARKADPTRWYGCEWASHLISHPEDASKCNWAVLESADIRTILEAQPQLVAKCNCSKLSAGSWARLLQARPEFGEICDKWDEIDAAHWIDLLKKQPSFVAKCRWRLLSKSDVALILKKVPNLELDSSELGMLEHQDWADVLSIHPFYAKYSDLSSLTGYDWVVILLKQPKLSVECPWDKLDAYNWLCLIKKRPEFAELCDKWAEYSVKSWIELLVVQPQLFARCPLDKFNVQEVTRLYCEMPTGSVPKERVASLSGEQLVSVLGSRPDYAQNASLVSLTGENWVALLKRQPSLSKLADWNRLSCKDWIDLLLTRPEFKGRCNWDVFDGDLLCEVMLNHPSLVNVDKCTFVNFSHQHWERILKRYPELESRLKGRCNNREDIEAKNAKAKEDDDAAEVIAKPTSSCVDETPQQNEEGFASVSLVKKINRQIIWAFGCFLFLRVQVAICRLKCADDLVGDYNGSDRFRKRNRIERMVGFFNGVSWLCFRASALYGAYWGWKKFLDQGWPSDSLLACVGVCYLATSYLIRPSSGWSKYIVCTMISCAALCMALHRLSLGDVALPNILYGGSSYLLLVCATTYFMRNIVPNAVGGTLMYLLMGFAVGFLSTPLAGLPPTCDVRYLAGANLIFCLFLCWRLKSYCIGEFGRWALDAKPKWIETLKCLLVAGVIAGLRCGISRWFGL